jgi:carbonic anhydrase/acetyltransferase-like protein (isoleucine patch superfamily)
MSQIFSLGSLVPVLEPGAWVAPGARVIGDVVLGADANVWFNAVLRGDVGPIRIGARTNVQDLTMVHLTGGRSTVLVEDDVTIGHSVTLHGCVVRRGCLVGMGAVLLDDAEIGEFSMVAAGSVVAPGTRIPPGVLALGSPARVKRDLTAAEREHMRFSAAHYAELARQYREQLGPLDP